MMSTKSARSSPRLEVTQVEANCFHEKKSLSDFNSSRALMHSCVALWKVCVCKIADIQSNGFGETRLLILKEQP